MSGKVTGFSYQFHTLISSSLILTLLFFPPFLSSHYRSWRGPWRLRPLTGTGSQASPRMSVERSSAFIIARWSPERLRNGRHHGDCLHLTAPEPSRSLAVPSILWTAPQSANKHLCLVRFARVGVCCLTKDSFLIGIPSDPAIQHLRLHPIARCCGSNACKGKTLDTNREVKPHENSMLWDKNGLMSAISNSSLSRKG